MNNKVLFIGKDYPVIQNTAYNTFEEATSCKVSDIQLILDSGTGLVYNNQFDESLIDYDVNYDNEQSNSHVFKDHLNVVQSIIQQHIGKNKIVEIGCGKGTFLEKLLGCGFDIIGFDPTYEGTNPLVIKQFYTKGCYNGEAHGIILRHVLEHIPNPVNFIKSLAENNNYKGSIYIEVPCLDWIIKNNTWYDFYYEHVNYFRISDFRKIFKNIKSIGHVFNGQYIYIVADLSEINLPEYEPDADLISLPNLNVESFLNQDIDVVWGAGSKGIIFSMLLSRHGIKPKYIVDINPHKIGKFAPVTGLQIISPDECLQYVQERKNVYIMNRNYENEIKKMTNYLYSYHLV